MSEKQYKEIRLEKKTYKLLEAEAKKDGLTIPQEIELATLHAIRKDDPELLEETKRKADPAVLHVFEKKTA